MHAVKLLHKWAQHALPSVHRSRLNTLFVGVDGVLSGQQLSLTAVGRHVRGDIREKHKIKRVDRLLGNPHLSAERWSIYRWLSRLIIGGCRHPTILVDWSDIDPSKRLFLLRAAICVGGRALPLYEQVHTRYHHRRDTAGFLTRLSQLLPDGCQPIIVTDAGFRSPWFKAVEALGWYYLGRVRNREYVCFPGTDDWLPAKSLYDLARTRPRAIGPISLPRREPFDTWAYVYKKPARRRHRVTVHGRPRRNAASLKHGQREKEPWLLVSNLPPRRHLEQHIVALYQQRMSIEEAFRDLKAYRHGFALRQNLGRHPERVANLILLATLATYCAWLTGLVGIKRRLDRGLQANTERRKKVLSVFFIGLRLLNQSIRIRQTEFENALDDVRDVVQTYAFNAG